MKFTLFRSVFCVVKDSLDLNSNQFSIYNLRMQQKREQVRKFLQRTLQKYGQEGIKKLNFQLGIDEAGRGPVFGTMVYSALWWPIELKQQLSRMGFDDSKALTDTKRQQLLELIDILKDKVVFYELRKISATEISTNMNNLKYNINLNELSLNAALELCRKAFEQGFNVTQIYADTVGDPQKYTTFMSSNLKKYSNIIEKITIQPKADSKFKVVSASSICAKVNRDRIITEWQFPQKINFKGVLGSGYPGDPKTKQWLVDNHHPVFGYPNIVRFSWSTSVNNLKQILKMRIIEDEQHQNQLKKLNYMEQNKKSLERDLWQIVGK